MATLQRTKATQGEAQKPSILEGRHLLLESKKALARPGPRWFWAFWAACEYTRSTCVCVSVSVSVSVSVCVSVSVRACVCVRVCVCLCYALLCSALLCSVLFLFLSLSVSCGAFQGLVFRHAFAEAFCLGLSDSTPLQDSTGGSI